MTYEEGIKLKKGLQRMKEDYEKEYDQSNDDFSHGRLICFHEFCTMLAEIFGTDILPK